MPNRFCCYIERNNSNGSKLSETNESRSLPKARKPMMNSTHSSIGLFQIRTKNFQRIQFCFLLIRFFFTVSQLIKSMAMAVLTFIFICWFVGSAYPWTNVKGRRIGLVKPLACRFSKMLHGNLLLSKIKLAYYPKITSAQVTLQ